MPRPSRSRITLGLATLAIAAGAGTPAALAQDGPPLQIPATPSLPSIPPPGAAVAEEQQAQQQPVQQEQAAQQPAEQRSGDAGASSAAAPPVPPVHALPREGLPVRRAATRRPAKCAGKTARKGRKASRKARKRCAKAVKRSSRRRVTARAAAASPQFSYGRTECLTVPFRGVTSNAPTVKAVDADPGTDQQYISFIPVRFRWNGSAWAYDSTGSWKTTFATEHAAGTQFWDGSRWSTIGDQGWNASSGYYAVAQYIFWHPTKSAPGDMSAYWWTPHTQNGSATSYCSL